VLHKTAVLDGVQMVKPWVRPLVRAWLAFEFHRKKPGQLMRNFYDPERPVFRDYLASSIRDIKPEGVTNLVIDLRRKWRRGGELCGQLVYHLTGATICGRPGNFASTRTLSPIPIRGEPGNSVRGTGRNSARNLPGGPCCQRGKPERPRVADPKSPFYVRPGPPGVR